MARSEKNLNAVFTDTASAIRAKTNTSETICPLDFADKINSIQTGGGGMKAYFDAGGKCAYSTASSFDGVINYSDTENVTVFESMFMTCKFLGATPTIDTSNATNMNQMFMGCSSLRQAKMLDTSKVTSMSSMFNSCEYLETVAEYNTSNVKDFSSMFAYDRNIKSAPNFDMKNAINISRMFYSCDRLLGVPLFNTSKVVRMDNMFGGCSRLQVIPALDASNVTNLYGIFDYDYEIREIHMTGMKVSFSLISCNKMERDALVEVLNNLATIESTMTLSLGSTNLAKLSDEDKAIATNKGWTLA